MGSKYSQMKIFHFQEKLDSLPQEVEEILSPIHIRIKPTNICNHNCSYCAYRVEDLQLGTDMDVRDSIPEAKMMEIIDDIIEMDVKAVTFSGGGEPFCYPFLVPAIKKLASSPVKFAALTNGALLKGEAAEIFAEKGSWLRVSMDGWNDESYYSYRGIKNGEFTKIISNLKSFIKLGGDCVLGVSLIVGKDNAEHIVEIVKKLRDVGVSNLKISPCIVSNSGKENNEYHQEIFEKVRNQIDILKEWDEPDFELFDSYHILDEKFEKDYHWCPYLQILPIIGADMNVYSCQDKAYNLETGVLGSIKDVRFKTFWFNDKNKFFRINPSKICNHHCISNSKNKQIFDYLDVDSDHLEFV